MSTRVRGYALQVASVVAVAGAVVAGGQVRGASLKGDNLTAGRVPLVGTSGLVEDDAGLAYNKATDALTVTGSGTFTGDLSAAGGMRQAVAQGAATLAAAQTALGVLIGGVLGGTFPVLRAGSVMGFTASLSVALTGVLNETAVFRVYKNGALLNAAFDLTFTRDGAETVLRVTVAKDTYAVVPGDRLSWVYTSGLILNTPVASGWIELEE